MQTDGARTGLQLRSLVKNNGDLELSLTSVPVPAPAANEVLVRVEAAPINPSDLGLLFAGADMTKASQLGTKHQPRVTARVPDAALKGMTARFDVSMPVGNEGAGVVVEAGSSEAAQALLGKIVAALGGAMYSQYRCVPVEQCLPLPAGATPAEGARHGRDHAQRRPHGVGAHRGRLQLGPDAQSDLPPGRDRPSEHRPHSRPSGFIAGDGSRSR